MSSEAHTTVRCDAKLHFLSVGPPTVLTRARARTSASLLTCFRAELLLPLVHLFWYAQTDLGLSPGGRIRLTLSKSLQPGSSAAGLLGGAGRGLTPPTPSLVSSAASASGGGGGAPPPAVNASVARALAFSLDDPNRFMVADSADRVAHASRLGDPPPPRAYRAPLRCAWKGLGAASGTSASAVGPGGSRGGGGGGAMGGVTCLSFSPFFRRYFLAGCGDGSVRLYKVRGVVRAVGKGYEMPQ